MTDGTADLTPLGHLVEVIAARGRAGRSLTALAGPPAAGKSTLSAAIVDRLNAAEPGSAGLLQMDGYHFDDRVLVPLGLRPRKGAPDTFDVAGLAHMLTRLRANTEDAIAVPVFDRSLEVARAAAGLVPRSVRHLVVEGNYLLLDRAPWRDLAPLFDTTVMIVADTDLLRRRLVARWEGHGLGAEEIAAKVDGNDLPNALLVLRESRPAEFRIAGET
ncbi:hypothetical protein [Methylobrevis pamukkalensis]|uniref:Nucleoside triphosphate hydrolase domain-containing protein n=1 Tax=Methylobrevis pamukkalensis TaxID=1439726 RepID=A0A1E3GQ54_9HYPH|nr:hypothetical protein [Methylobrevis pamukkalensis]ODN66178.1 nucleoside triphosphate hydrolase domain-containing protein [Methylobrevis pamukkalensis]